MDTRYCWLVLAAGAAVSTMASPAHAITQTQTVGPVSFSTLGTTVSTSTSPTSFAGFNASLGTLTAVKLTNSSGGNLTGAFGGSIGIGTFLTSGANPVFTAQATPTFTFSNGSTITGPADNAILTPNFVTVGANPVSTTANASGSYSGATQAIAIGNSALLAYFTASPTINSYSALWTLNATNSGAFFNNAITFSGTDLSLTYVYDDGVNPVPGPLPVLGAGAAFGFSRKLRQRIRSSAG